MKKKLFPLKGIVTVLNTPFDRDLVALANNIKEALNVGVTGFLIPVLAAEVYKLSDVERFPAGFLLSLVWQKPIF